MIHISSKKEAYSIDDDILKNALLKEFDRLPDDFEYPKFGYFIVIESIEELKQSIPLKYGDLSQTPDNISECIEIIEEFKGYSQIVCILYEDFGVSLFVKDEVATKSELDKCFFN